MPARVIIISDGKRGHENQSRVIARMLGDQTPVMMYLRDQVKEGGAVELALRLRLAWLGKNAIGHKNAVNIVKRLLRPDSADELRALAEEIREHAGALALFTVSTGTPPATLNLVMARMLGAKSVVNMTPSLLPRSRFDLNIVPAHDFRAGEVQPENLVVSSLALGYHDTIPAMHAAGQMITEYDLGKRGPYWGVAIGGPSKACPWAGDRVLDELAALHGLARGEDRRLLVTTSRRTPEHCLAWLRKHYVGSENVAYFLDASVSPVNPLPAIYELAETVFVTGDSFSMVSEAIQAGHRPVIIRVRVGDAPGKLGRAMDALATDELIRRGTSEGELPERVLKPAAKRLEPNSSYKKLRTAVRNKLRLPVAD